MACLAIEKAGFTARLVIFDKDGTLIDFHGMWSTWIEALAQSLERAARRPLAHRIFLAVDYDSVRRRALAGGALAIAPVRVLRQLVTTAIREASIDEAAAERLVASGWFTPDPVALASPLTDLRGLFAALNACGLLIAVATSDDRAPTEITLRALGLDTFVADCACGDDALHSKPAPDMVLQICHRLGIAPEHALVVGDSSADLQMGRAAGAGMCIGVLSGASQRGDLVPFADAIIGSIDELLATPQASTASQCDSNVC